MASEHQKQKQKQHQYDETLENPESGDPDDQEIRQLERQVQEMAQRILHFRKTFPDLLKRNLESCLAAQRPPLPQSIMAEPESSENRDGGAGEHVALSSGVSKEEDPETAEKTQIIKLQISSNVSAMPVILKRMNDCIEAIDRLDECNADVHPVFKRKRTH